MPDPARLMHLLHELLEELPSPDRATGRRAMYTMDGEAAEPMQLFLIVLRGEMPGRRGLLRAPRMVEEAHDDPHEETEDNEKHGTNDEESEV